MGFDGCFGRFKDFDRFKGFGCGCGGFGGGCGWGGWGGWDGWKGRGCFDNFKTKFFNIRGCISEKC